MKDNTSLALSQSQSDKIINKIQSTVNKIEESASKGYISIAGDVAKLKDSAAYKTYGYKNISDMCKDLFGMSKSTTYNLLQINDNFFTEYKINEEAKEFSVRDMLNQIADKKAELADKKTKAVSDKSEESEVVDVVQYTFADISDRVEYIDNTVLTEIRARLVSDTCTSVKIGYISHS